jgi:capsular polysaccharide transport system permease protein
MAAPNDTPLPASEDATALIAAIQRDPRNLPALIGRAEQRFAAGDRPGAIALLEAGVRLVPEDFSLNRVLSGFLAAEQSFAQAEAYAVKAVELCPDAGEARIHLAGILFARARLEAAIPHLLAYLERNPAGDPAWYKLSIALFETGRHEQGIEAISRAITLCPEVIDYRLHMASLLTARACYGDALTQLAIAAGRDPQDARIARAVSGNLEALGDLTAAYREAERAARLAPENAEFSRHLDLLAARMGRQTGPTAPALGDVSAWTALPSRVRRRKPHVSPAQRLRERGRIIYALALRDIRTRHSRSHLGYLWAVLEPISHLLTLGVMFSYFNTSPPPVGNSLFEFYCSGLLPYLMVSHIATDVMFARSASGALLLLPKLRTTDIIFSKTFLNLMTEILVGCLVFSAFGVAGYRLLPAHLFTCAAGLSLLALLAMGIGTINMVAQNFFHGWDTIFQAILRLLYFGSGLYYSPISMPDAIRNILVWNPILQGVELFRMGFFADYDPFWINIPYLINWVLVSLVIGLGLEKTLRRRLRRQT